MNTQIRLNVKCYDSMGVYYVRVNGEGVQKHSRGVCTGVIRGYTVQSGAPRGIVNTYFFVVSQISWSVPKCSDRAGNPLPIHPPPFFFLTPQTVHRSV